MERYSYKREPQNVPNPSFSSSLLDSIYRSIDRGEDDEEVDHRETMRKGQQISCRLKGKNNLGLKDEEMLANFQRLQIIEKWTEKESEKADGRRRFSSDSNSGCRFSSSAIEKSVFRVSTNEPSSSSCYSVPKPIKTSVSIHQEKPKFEKTKSRALKFYDDLKKSKQPISPGGKLASFLNYLFSSGNAKEANTEASSERKMIKSANASKCSSASSFSRSCLSKTPSSENGKAINVTKKSVRFYPVRVIVDEDSQPCGHKNLYRDKSTSLVDVSDIRCSVKEEVNNHIMEKNRRVEEAAKRLLRNYQKRVELEHDLRSRNHVKNQIRTDEDDDDAESCSSSDLFELDNLSAIGMERYTEELPVYETTHLHTNFSISNQSHDSVTKAKTKNCK